MKDKVLHLFLANAILVLAIFFLFLLALGWALPKLAVFKGVFVQGALATFSVLALLSVIFELSNILRSGSCQQDETEQNGTGR